MVERFLFNGIHMDGAGIPIGQGVELPSDIHLGTADASVARLKKAAIGAYLALYVGSVGCIVKALNGPLPWFFGSILFKDITFDISTPLTFLPYEPVPRA